MKELFVRILLCISLVAQSFSLPDVYFLPGFMGNFLFATLKNVEYLPSSCNNADIPTNETFLIYPNVSLTARHPACLADLLQLQYDPSKEPSFSSTPGVEISVKNFGGISGIIPVYLPFFTQLKEWGYKFDKSAFGVPYDFRFSTAEGLASTGLFSDLKNLIEKNSRLRSTKAFLIGHSNGGPTIYSFLASMTLDWKKTYLAGVINLSGNLLGQMNAYAAFFHPVSKDMQRMETSWEATYTSAPWGDYEGLAEVKDFIVTYNGTDQETQYSPRLADMQKLFNSIDRSDWTEKLTRLYPSMDRSKAPEGLDVFCLFGTEVDTTYAYVFERSIQDDDPVSKISMKGDGNQDIIDNEFCKVWETDVVSSQRVFEAKGFPGVHHMQMCSNEGVLEEVHRILLSYL